jgi:hypothetical protein
MITDTERLDWLEKAEGFALISDDAGHWAVVSEGVQNLPDKHPADINTVFLIKKKEWRPTVREAIDAAIRKCGKDGPYATKAHSRRKGR